MLEVGQDLARNRGKQNARSKMLNGAGDRWTWLAYRGDSRPQDRGKGWNERVGPSRHRGSVVRDEDEEKSWVRQADRLRSG